MAYVTQSRASMARPADRAPGIFAQLGEALARRRIYRRTLNELRQLSDRELADLGISRMTIVDVAHEAAYGK